MIPSEISRIGKTAMILTDVNSSGAVVSTGNFLFKGSMHPMISVFYLMTIKVKLIN